MIARLRSLFRRCKHDRMEVDYADFRRLVVIERCTCGYRRVTTL